MKDLKTMAVPAWPADRRALQETITIFEKMAFSDITKEHVRKKLHDLRTRQVPQRTVLLDMDDEDLTLYWFKNWLHPKLKSFFPPSPRSKVGCSARVLEMDAENDAIHFYENGQQNFDYTLSEIEEWAGVSPADPAEPMTNEQYLKQYGSLCPNCSSGQLEGGSIDICGEEATQKMGCNDCNATWDDVYKLVGYDNLEE